jgi:pimeloyl-ACP methyl ester carboxylesterase
VLGWCNGARVAIELARNYPEIASALVLVAPTLRRLIVGIESALCPFELGLYPVLDALRQKPELADTLVKAIASQGRPPDWKTFAGDAVRRARALFRMPAKEQTAGLFAPLASGDSLAVLARQILVDEAYPVDDRLHDVEAPIMVIAGEYDHMVSNSFTSEMVRRSRKSLVTATISGAGHYIHDLQYSYFRLLLDKFVREKRIPDPSMRVAVTLKRGD